MRQFSIGLPDDAEVRRWIDSSPTYSATLAARDADRSEPNLCDCPPGTCLQDNDDPLVSGVSDFHSFVDAIGEQIISDIIGYDDEDLEDEVLSSEEKQLDQLGDIVEATVALAGLYAAMVDRERNEF
jgi:hypothetical protein